MAFLVDPACQHARVTLSHRAGEGRLEVFGDPSGVRAALLNLTLNAIEAAGPGGTVRLEATALGEEVAVEVGDSGAGPPPELGDSLCEAFVTSKPEGVGLGLALAHRVAADHGGRLAWTRQDGETRFRLTLPRRRRDAAGGRMSRILVVDDEASICWAFRESLGDEGHHVEVAASVEEGLTIAAAGPLDAVVLDVRLPGVDGLTAMGAFRERIGAAPIIVITAFGNLETAVRAMEGAPSITWSSRSTSTRRPAS